MLNLARVCLDNRFGVPAFSRADLPKDMSELAPDLSIRVDIGSPARIAATPRPIQAANDATFVLPVVEPLTHKRRSPTSHMREGSSVYCTTAGLSS